MKKRVTLTIEPKISHQARAAARARGMSVSGLVEHLLAQEIGPETKAPAGGKTFSQRWAGRFRLADKKNDLRFERLKTRHAL